MPLGTQRLSSALLLTFQNVFIICKTDRLVDPLVQLKRTVKGDVVCHTCTETRTVRCIGEYMHLIEDAVLRQRGSKIKRIS